jgi:hypothetical protein
MNRPVSVEPTKVLSAKCTSYARRLLRATRIELSARSLSIGSPKLDPRSEPGPGLHATSGNGLPLRRITAHSVNTLPPWGLSALLAGHVWQFPPRVCGRGTGHGILRLHHVAGQSGAAMMRSMPALTALLAASTEPTCSHTLMPASCKAAMNAWDGWPSERTPPARPRRCMLGSVPRSRER